MIISRYSVYTAFVLPQTIRTVWKFVSLTWKASNYSIASVQTLWKYCSKHAENITMHTILHFFWKKNKTVFCLVVVYRKVFMASGKCLEEIVKDVMILKGCYLTAHYMPEGDNCKGAELAVILRFCFLNYFWPWGEWMKFYSNRTNQTRGMQRNHLTTGVLPWDLFWSFQCFFMLCGSYCT